MVNEAQSTHPSEAAGLVRLLIPALAHPAFDALREFDQVIAGLIRAANQPMVAQMRVTWWYDAVGLLGSGPAPAHPALVALAARVVPYATVTPLQHMVAGWEELLSDDPLDDASLARYADGRGGGLFGAISCVLGPWDGPLTAAGAAWALSDLAANCGSVVLRDRASVAAAACRKTAFSVRWPRRARPLGVLALLDRADAPHGLGGLIRVTRFRATGLWREPPPASLPS